MFRQPDDVVNTERVVARLRFEAMARTATAGEMALEEKERAIRDEAAALERELEALRSRHMEELARARDEAGRSARDLYDRALAEQVQRERERVAQMLAEFREQRSGYFAKVEAEVVKLSLSIAARVLHREVSLDPMLLRAVVRVALEKVAEQSGTVLRVPMAEVDHWQSWVVKEKVSLSQVVGDARLTGGDCVLETAVGRVELGVAAQLEEIERGFFDLLQQRPA